MAAPRLNTQAMLAEMRREQREDHQSLVTAMGEGFEKVTTAMSTHVLEDTTKFAAIDKRLSTVENTRRTMRWLGATVIVAVIGVLLEFLSNHLPTFIGQP